MFICIHVFHTMNVDFSFVHHSLKFHWFRLNKNFLFVFFKKKLRDFCICCSFVCVFVYILFGISKFVVVFYINFYFDCFYFYFVLFIFILFCLFLYFLFLLMCCWLLLSFDSFCWELTYLCCCFFLSNCCCFCSKMTIYSGVGKVKILANCLIFL